MAAFVESLSVNDSAFEVIVGQGRIMTLKEDIAIPDKREPVIAVGDPTVIDVTVLNARQLRIIGHRVGVTDLAIITGRDKVYNFEVRVVADLNTLRAQLQCLFPDARVKLSQFREHVVVEGQARDTRQVALIEETIKAYLRSVMVSQEREVTGDRPGGGSGLPLGKLPLPDQPTPSGQQPQPGQPPKLPAGAPPTGALPEAGGPLEFEAKVLVPRVINLVRVPGPQQVLVKVRVAELNRTAFRQIGADLIFANAGDTSVGGTRIGGGSVGAGGIVNPALGGLATNPDPAITFFNTSASTTVFGIFERNFEFLLQALRRNSMLKILAEPNLVAMNGHVASFLAGGEFPVPISQIGGGTASVTVEFKEFGVRLVFVPYIMDGDVIRLTVAPEVSTIDFTIGTVLVPGGTPVPGLNTRKAQTTVELKEGQTLAIAGLLQVSLDGQTSRLPVMGDLPVLGPFFSNTTGNRVERELIVLVTPYLVESMDCGEVLLSPGQEVHEPDDWEFFLHARIESHLQSHWRSTTRQYSMPMDLLRCYFRLEQQYFHGPSGFCE